MFIIGFAELFAAHKSVAGATYLYFPSATIEMAAYLTMTLACSFLLRWLESRMDGHDSFKPCHEGHIGTYERHGSLSKDCERQRKIPIEGEKQMSDSILEVQHLGKNFGENVVLRDIDFAVHTGDVTSIIGISGSGKSTLLRCINLLEEPSSARFCFTAMM